MAFGRVAIFPGGTREQYEAIEEALGENRNTSGRLFHAAGPTSDGWMIVHVWETRDQLERFIKEDLGPAFAKVGDRGYTSPPQITDFDAVHVVG